MALVMVVDDDDDVRASVADSLRAHGHEAVEFASGAEALAALAREPLPALVLLDLLMPGMSGRQFLAARAADARLGSVPVVVLTGGRHLGVGDLPGATAVLDKPFMLDQLLAVVAAHASR